MKPQASLSLTFTRRSLHLSQARSEASWLAIQANAGIAVPLSARSRTEPSKRGEGEAMSIHEGISLRAIRLRSHAPKEDIEGELG